MSVACDGNKSETPKSPPNARREARYKVGDANELNCTIEWDSNGWIESSAAVPLDLSANGARLECEFPIQANEAVKINISADNIGISLTVSATVRWIEPTTQGKLIIGCEFNQTMPEDILPKLAAAGELNRRQETRFPILLYANAKQELNQKVIGVRIEEYSRGGIRLFSPVEMNLRDRILLRVKHQSKSVSLVLNPRWQIGVAAGHFVGCSFVDANGYESLTALATTPDSKVVIIKKVSQPWIWGGIGAAAMWFVMQFSKL